jgi:hypothetical protein
MKQVKISAALPIDCVKRFEEDATRPIQQAIVLSSTCCECTETAE